MHEIYNKQEQQQQEQQEHQEHLLELRTVVLQAQNRTPGADANTNTQI